VNVSCRALLAAAAIVLVAAGCGGGDRRSGSMLAVPAQASTAGQPSSSVPPSASPTAPSYRPPADGADLTACLDGTCEVEIRVGDVVRFGAPVRTDPPITALLVVRVDPRSVMFALPSGSMIGGFGTLTINGGLVVEMVFADGTRAVVRFSPTSG
jgi:hypothetical protein